MKLYAIFTFAFVCIFQKLYTQKGLPLLVNYLPKEYNAGNKNFDLIQDARGIILVANEEGILSFDGTYWNLTPIPNKALPNTLDLTADGKVLIAGNNFLGFLETNKQGNYIFKTFHTANWGNSRKIYVFNDGFYVSTDSTLLYYHQGKIQNCTLGNAISWNKNLRLVVHHQWGLGAVQGTQFLPIKEAQPLASKKLVSIVKIQDNQYLVCSAERIWNFQNGLLLPFNNKAVNIYKSGIITDIRRSKNGYLIISTLRSGVILLGPKGDLVYWLNRNAGLESDAVYGTMVDDRERLWMACEVGISFADLNPGITFFSERSGLKGSVNQIYKKDKELYAATDRGLFVLSFENQIPIFKPIKGVISNTFKIKEYQKELFVASFSGLFRLQKDSTIVVLKEPTLDLCLTQSGKLYAVTENKIVRVKKHPKYKIFETQTVDTLSQNIEYILEDKKRDWFWIGNSKSVSLIHVLNDSIFKQYPFFIDAEDLKFAQTTNKILLTNNGIFKLDTEKWRFVKDSSFGEAWLRQPVNFLHKDPKGYLWLNANEKLYQATWNVQNKEYQWKLVPIKKIKSLIVNDFYRENDVVFWLGTTQGLIRFEPKAKEIPSTKFFALPRKIYINRDSLIFEGNFMENGKLVNYQPISSLSNFQFYTDLQSIEFHFTATTYEDPTGTYFQYRLIGLDTLWEDWSKNNIFTFTNLPIGKYTLQVRAKNILEEISPIYSFQFEIKPFWYQTTIAKIFFWIIGILALGGIIWLGIIINTKRLKAQNEWLQSEIQKATAEIQKQKAEIEAQNLKLIETNQIISAQKEEIERDKQIIEEKNQEILDSITYAKRIQTALIPSDENLSKAFGNEYFVVFFPRDIVSGDFYWLTEENGIYIMAVADCTGHGVPGGFMTMIGNTLLNQIVGFYNIIEPHQILNQLHKEIRTALKQDEGSSEVRDGMDLAIFAYHKNKNLLQLASAQRPVYFIRNGELQEIKGDKFPIGGKDPERNYTLHEINLQPGDTFYFTSDGYADQFNPNDKKFSTGRLKKLILEIYPMPMKEQGKILTQTFLEWKGDAEQIDDVLVFGVKF
jgi:serine phosphatase RsbU (regulator of sigma subunit)